MFTINRIPSLLSTSKTETFATRWHSKHLSSWRNNMHPWINICKIQLASFYWRINISLGSIFIPCGNCMFIPITSANDFKVGFPKPISSPTPPPKRATESLKNLHCSCWILGMQNQTLFQQNTVIRKWPLMLLNMRDSQKTDPNRLLFTSSQELAPPLHSLNGVRRRHFKLENYASQFSARKDNVYTSFINRSNRSYKT